MLGKVYVDQDGLIWDQDYAVCPGCGGRTDFDDRVPGSGYFRCSSCRIIYDEPDFADPEAAFVGEVDDD